VDPEALAAAVACVRAGGLLAYPTETVFGLGADARSERAVAALRRWKGRPDGQPLSVLVAGPETLDALGLAPPAAARALAARFWPGPLTLVVPAPRGAFAAGVAREDGAVGLRCSAHPVAAALARALAAADVGPITATSLNRSGEPPAAGLAAARRLCREHPGPLLVAAGACGPVSCAAPSTVVDCTGPGFQLIREGAIPEAALAEALVGAPSGAHEGEASQR